MIEWIAILGASVIGVLILISYVTAKAALFIAILSGMGLAIFYGCLNNAARMRVGMAPIAIALTLPLAAWLLPSVWLIYSMMAGLVPLLARKTGHVPALYMFALLLLPPLDQPIFIGSLKLFEFGAHDALALGSALTLIQHPQWRAPRSRALDLPCLSLLAVLVFCAARGTSATNYLRALINVALDCGLPFYIISRGVRSAGDLRLCMLYLAGGAAALAMVLLYEAHTAWPMYNALYPLHGIEIQLLVKARGGVMRAGGPFLESTSVAMVLIFCFLAAWLSRREARSPLHHVALLTFLLFGLLPPQSRGAWIGLLIAMTLADLYRRRLRQPAVRLALIGMLGGLLMTLGQANPRLAESLGLAGGSRDSAAYRQLLLHRGMEEFWQSPWIGYPMSELSQRLADLRQGEGIIDFVNTYLFFALNSGLAGLAIFVGAFLFYVALLLATRGRQPPDARDRDVEAFVFACLLTPMEMILFTSFGGRPQLFAFAFFAFAVALAGAPRRQASAFAAGSLRPA